MCDKQTACPPVPGEKMHMMSHVMDAGATLMQSHAPVKQICAHVCGLHVYDSDRNRQLIAHHYCSHLNEEVRQCIIYDGPDAGSRLIGIEYIITERLFLTLPEEEKRYWHSHCYEVKSGMLVLPGLPEVVEHKEMEKLVGTYGKTWHTWQVDRGDPLPYGAAQLMMAFTRDGQASTDLLAEKDRVTGISTVDRRTARETIPETTVLPGADEGIHNRK